MMVSGFLLNAVLIDAGLTRGDLSNATLVYAVLRRATLTDTILEGADLTGANLAGADPSGSNLTGSYLLGADLTGINYDSETDFLGAFYDANTQFDPLFDTSGLIFVLEPGAGALMAFGVTLLASLRAIHRSRREAREPSGDQGV